jgi:hypothetical protein
MNTQIKIVQRTLDDLNERLLANVRANVEVTQYTNRPNGEVLCQMFLRNGMIVEGYAVRSKSDDGKMIARRRALKQVILIEQYLEAERLYQAATNAG